jgi:hypothetical protein
MDDRVGGLGAARQAVGILERPAMHLRAGGRDRCCGGVGTREAEHRMPGGHEFGNDRGADEARRSCNEDTHVQHLRMKWRLTICRPPRAVKT